MTKRFCDQCGSEIDHYSPYYLEEVRAVNVIVSTSAKRDPSDMIVSKRDLCVACTPKTINPETSAEVNGSRERATH